MKAVMWTKYGPPEGLQFQEVEKPAPADNEVLIKVYASTVSAGDCELRRLKLPILFQLPLRIFIGIRRPTRIRILGQELAGEIEATGKSVTKYKAGDPVYAWTAFRLGGYAEYACLRETAVMAIKPSSLKQRMPGLKIWYFSKS